MGRIAACFNAVAEEYKALNEALDQEFAACETDACRRYHLSRIAAVEQSGAFDEMMNLLAARQYMAKDFMPQPSRACSSTGRTLWILNISRVSMRLGASSCARKWRICFAGGAAVAQCSL
ncbi:MAG: hypothetical protein ABGX47_01055 [Martelella sp.]|uniref:hypothetical protein n=1 Tax=Martelella sp. TaxID=1969699 RepID=UPI003241E481